MIDEVERKVEVGLSVRLRNDKYIYKEPHKIMENFLNPILKEAGCV